MAVKGKQNARIILTLGAYAMAGLATTLGIAWAGQLLDGEVTEAVWIVPPVAASTEVPADARVVVRRFSSWCGISYKREVWYLPWADGPPPQRQKLTSVIAGQLRSMPTESEGWGVWPLKDAILSHSVITDYRGFPFSCLWSWTNGAQRIRVAGASWDTCFDPAALMGWSPDLKWQLPVAPLWLGLIANTIICGLAWFMLLFLPLHLKPCIRASRVRRGLCAACEYDLTGVQERCPECGSRYT